MSDEPDKQGNGEGAPVAGELLAKARRAREISLQEIAKDLHLDEPMVRALEQNDFEALGAPVFAKGYLRKYAELVGVAEDDIIADYYRLNRSAGAPPLVTMRARPVGQFNAVPWIGGLAVLLVVVLGALWWFTLGVDWFADRRGTRIEAPVATDEREARDEVATPPAEEPEDPAVALPAPAAGPAAGERPPTPGTSGAEAAQESVAQAAPERPAGGAAEGHLAVRLAFSADCWTEVTDANGRRLYFGLGTDGDEVTVSGEPPLNVLLGDSENVAVFVEGAAYPIPASARRGETARLTLTAR